jgi:predicted murein hydrolase (TIGR00659 family)
MTPDLTESLFAMTNFLGAALTFGLYALATWLYARLKSPVFLNPLLIAIAMLAAVLHAADVPYETYFASAEPIHWLLSPVVVLLSVPLWRQFDSIRGLGTWLAPVLLLGATVGITTAAGLAWAMGLSHETVATLAPKSVTTPVAIHLSDRLGGVPSITALVVILTGLAGATIGLPLLRLCGIRDPRATGLAIGVASHAIGTARAFQVDAKVGAYASLGMILNAIATALLIGGAILLFY